ncbi:MlaE family lipid ABC transporter permease subunit [bacterium]|nr:MAG: MlaE family lipid ABC transporter permease subunit [bacterium]
MGASINGDTLALRPSGSWTALYGSTLEAFFNTTNEKLTSAKHVAIDMSKVSDLDTVGAWIFEKISRRAVELGRSISVGGIPDHYRGLIEEVRQVNRNAPSKGENQTSLLSRVESLGRAAFVVANQLAAFIAMLGALGYAIFRAVRNPRSFRFKSFVYHLHQVGWKAIPIIVLVTFLIGAIIAQQGIFHFRKFGADSYVVDMVGILVLREIGVLIVAIMVAGRSGSAYTAELGSMKMREEIDALSTMGRDPVEVLILPRILALMLALPILTFIGSMAALYGGGLVAWLYGGMSPAIFIARLHEAVSVSHFEVGMIKAPFMALIIGIIASSEGLLVKGSAESLGKQTTTSVVKSIFLVIVLDGAFAVFFASIGM